jgi:acyl-CoA synthetase (AMP-forming)/AMP-acid ligase II
MSSRICIATADSFATFRLNVACKLNLQGQAQVVLTCLQLHKRAERIGALLIDKGKVNVGDPVALVYGPGLDLICAFYGCLYAG